jgi:multidrug resistance efflux pump
MRIVFIFLTLLTELWAFPLTERGWLESSNSKIYRVVITGQIIDLKEHGQRVKAGDVIARQDNSSTLEAIENIEEGLLELKSELSTAENEFLVTLAELEEEQKMNESNLDLAKAKFKEARDKPEPGELRLSEIELELATLELNRAKENLERQLRMVEKGFGSPNSLQSYQIRVKGREQSLNIQTASHRLLLEGSDEELLIELESDVKKWRDLILRHSKRKEMSTRSQELALERIKKRQQAKQLDLANRKDILSRSVITAKEDGLLLYMLRRDWSSGGSLKPIKVGDHLWSSEKIASIIDTSAVRVVVPVHESNLDRIRLGQSAEVNFPALPRLTAKGKVTTASMTARDLSEILPQGYLEKSHGQSYFKVAIELEKQNPLYRPGMSASITFEDRSTP